VELRGKAFTMVLGLGWFVALIAVVGIALGTRSEAAGTNDASGPTIVVLTVPVILLAAWRLRHPLITWLTIGAAGSVSCVLAWNVLHDTHSTAAIGIPYVPVCAGFLVLVGIAIQDRDKPFPPRRRRS
jgi:hypothetical protein